MFVIVTQGHNYVNIDGLAKSHTRCHCEERSDVAISLFQLVANYKIASLRSQ